MLGYMLLMSSNEGVTEEHFQLNVALVNLNSDYKQVFVVLLEEMFNQ